jgi:hypothetical protein
VRPRSDGGLDITNDVRGVFVFQTRRFCFPNRTAQEDKSDAFSTPSSQVARETPNISYNQLSADPSLGGPGVRGLLGTLDGPSSSDSSIRTGMSGTLNVTRRFARSVSNSFLSASGSTCSPQSSNCLACSASWCSIPRGRGVIPLGWSNEDDGPSASSCESSRPSNRICLLRCGATDFSGSSISPCFLTSDGAPADVPLPCAPADVPLPCAPADIVLNGLVAWEGRLLIRLAASAGHYEVMMAGALYPFRVGVASLLGGKAVWRAEKCSKRKRATEKKTPLGTSAFYAPRRFWGFVMNAGPLQQRSFRTFRESIRSAAYQ